MDVPNPNMKRGQKSVNPKGRPTKKKRTDGWFSFLTGTGTASHDSITSYEFGSDNIDQSTAQELWKGDDISAKLVELPPSEMTREGFSIQIDGDKALAEIVESEWERLSLIDLVRQANEYDRAYGGAGIYLGTIDSNEIDKEINLRTTRSLDFLTLMSPRELRPETWFNNPLAKDYKKTRSWVLSGNSTQNTEVHASRVVLWTGVQTNTERTGHLQGFGDSLFVRTHRIIRDFNIAWASTATLLQDFSPAIHKMKDLAILLGHADGEQALQRRMQGIQMSRATCRSVVIDSEEEWARNTTPVGGLAELLRENMVRVAAAVDIPVAKLFGVSAAGLNATDESTLRMYYDKIGAMQRRSALPQIRKVTDIILATMGRYDVKYTIIPRPLWSPSEQQIAETRLKQAQTDQIYIMNSVVSSEEIALSRFGGDSYSIETTIDFDGRQSLELSDPEVNAEINKATEPHMSGPEHMDE